MKLLRKVGSTSEIWQVFVQDSSSTTGAGLTGLAFGTSGLTAYFHRDTDTTATAITLVTMTVGTFTSSGFKEIDSTHMPGWYQFCPPNAALATGAKSCGFHLQGAANMAPLPIEVDLGGQVDVTHVGGTAQTARDLGASVLLSTGTAAGQLDFTAGVVKVNVVQSLGTAITNEDFTVASATSTTVTLPTTYSSGASLPDDDRYIQCALSVTGGTGAGQVVLLTTGAAGARVYNVKANTMPVQLDATSKCTVIGTWQADAEQFAGQTITCAGAVTIPAATLASTTNITAGTIATVTNQLTAAALATGVWQDATAGDFTAANSIGKSLGGAFTALGTSVYSVGALANAPAPTAAAVWDLATSGHTTSGTFGAAMNAAGSSGDPLATTVPGAYGAGTAGFLIGTYLNATISSRSTFAGGAVASVTAPVTLSQSFPANFSTLVISGAGIVSANTTAIAGTAITGNGVSPKFGV